MAKASGAAGYSTARRKDGTTLPDAVNGKSGRRAPVAHSIPGKRRALLNPEWVVTLMAFPAGWLSRR